MVESIQSNKVLLMLTKLQSVAHNHIFCRISFTNSVTVQAAKRLYPSRLRAWNFASHVTFLRGFCEEVTWVLRGISVSFAKFCEIFSVERGKQA